MPMCQKIWAGVSPSLPIPKLTQYIQFVKSGQKIWAGPPSFGQNPKEQLLFFGRPSLTNGIVAPQHRNPIPNVATENSLQQVQPRIKTRSKDFPILLLRPSPAQWANFGDCLSPALAGTFRIAVTLWHPSGGGKICSKSLWHRSGGCNVCDKISWHPINQERQIFWQMFL